MTRALIQNYRPIEHIKVSKDMVDQMEERILNQLGKEPYVHLRDQLAKLGSMTLNYTTENFNAEIEKMSEQLSMVMAYQEALFNLMTSGQIMPVKISNVYNTGGGYHFKIAYQENRGMSFTSGETEISIPILVHETFMLRPSLKY
ncbi:hypothetical protein ACFCP7_27340 [Paenibacillus elgii]